MVMYLSLNIKHSISQPPETTSYSISSLNLQPYCRIKPRYAAMDEESKELKRKLKTVWEESISEDSMNNLVHQQKKRGRPKKMVKEDMQGGKLQVKDKVETNADAEGTNSAGEREAVRLEEDNCASPDHAKRKMHRRKSLPRRAAS